MAVRKAILIQDVTELLRMINPCLDLIISYYEKEGVSRQSAFQWIVCEELGLMYGLFDKYHNRNQPAYIRIYEYLNSMLPFPISVYIRQYIAAPRIYPDDNSIVVVCDGRDLFLHYSMQTSYMLLTY